MTRRRRPLPLEGEHWDRVVRDAEERDAEDLETARDRYAQRHDGTVRWEIVKQSLPLE